VISQSSFVLF